MKTPEQKNYLGYFRGIGILIFLALSFFVWVSPAEAGYVFRKNCVAELGPVGNDHWYAMFVITRPQLSSDTNVDQDGDPPLQLVDKEVCMSVRRVETAVSFNMLVGADLFQNFWQEYDARLYPTIVRAVKLITLPVPLKGTDERARRYIGEMEFTGEVDPMLATKYRHFYFMGFFGEALLNQDSVRWTFNGSPATSGVEKVDHGRSATVTISALETHEGDTPVQVTCAKCADVGGTVRQGQGNQWVVSLDSRRIVDTMKLQLPDDVDFKLKGVTGRGHIQKYSEFTLTLHIDPFDCSQFNGKKNECTNQKCFWFAPDNQCASRADPTICPKLSQILCGRQSDGRAVGSEICTWIDQLPGQDRMKPENKPDGTLGQCVGPTVSSTIDQYAKPEGYQGPIPDCAWSGSCRDVNALLQVLLNYGQRIFGMIGMLAFVMFVIGGFMMIFSMGSPDRVKKGRDILIAAVVGMIIMFSAYILVNFLLDALGVGEGFRAIQ